MSEEQERAQRRTDLFDVVGQLRQERDRLLVLHAWLTKAISTEQAQAYFEAKPDDGALWRFSLHARKRGRELVEGERDE